MEDNDRHRLWLRLRRPARMPLPGNDGRILCLNGEYRTMRDEFEKALADKFSFMRRGLSAKEQK